MRAATCRRTDSPVRQDRKPRPSRRVNDGAGVARHVTKPLEPWQQALVAQWTGISVTIAKKYTPRGQPISSDMVAEGHMGLVNAASRFKTERKIAFPTYATYWVRAHILLYIMRNQGPVRFDGNQDNRKVFFGAARARRRFPEGTPEQLARAIGVPVEIYESMQLRMKKTDVSLDDENVFMTLSSHVANAEERLGNHEERENRRQGLAKALKKVRGFNEREAYIIQQRFLSENKKTLQEIATELGLSRERVRQCELRALSRLRTVLSRDKKFAVVIGDFI